MSLTRLADRIDRFTDATGRAVSWLVLALVLVTFFVAVARYLLNVEWFMLDGLRQSLRPWYNEASNALTDLIQYLHAIIFMVGIAYALKLGDHVRIDIFYRKFSERTRAKVNIIGVLTLLYPTFIFIIYMSWAYVAQAWSIMEGSPRPGGLPALWFLKSFILVMAVMMLAQGTSLLCRNLLLLKTGGDS